MSDTILKEKHFKFAEREPTIYAEWEQSTSFKPEACKDNKAPVFSLAMPPPNANGELHLGHIFGETIMDILARYHRAKGKRVLLVPGKDHAGIQTQVVFERKLRAEGIEPTLLDRNDFYNRCYDFCIDRAKYNREQEKSIGISADFERELFTLDPRLNKIIFETFEQMFNEGLVYRGTRIVNWSVHSQTAISDVEVEYAEAKGNIWQIAYPLIDKNVTKTFPSRSLEQILLKKETTSEKLLLFISGATPEPESLVDVDGQSYIVFSCSAFDASLYESSHEERELFSTKFSIELSKKERVALAQPQITLLECLPYLDSSKSLLVATTRPETLLGDTALAVHPKDIRYQHLVGNYVELPLCNRKIPIIADDRIDLNFGTGVVKVTPAHDFLDNEIGKTHNLEVIQVIGKDGKITDSAPEAFRGLSTLDCRNAVVQALESKNLLLSVKEHNHKVPISERGKDVIEPLMAEQWWIAVDKPLARLSGKSLKQRVLELVSSDELKVYPSNFKHQFTQWFEKLRDWNISRQITWGHRIPAWYKDGKIAVGSKAPEGGGWQQDPDTFDTWFSSGQWAYSTLAALQLINLEAPKESTFFPTHTMVMGRDILLFWACRMLLMTAFRLNDLPWKNIYFTGLIRDQHGQKMSKSKGNGVEPKDWLEKYGADAVRLGMLMGTSPGIDTNLGEKKIEGYSKFINKLWNSAKLIDQKIAPLTSSNPNNKPAKATYYTLDSSKWILSEVSKVMLSIDKKLENYEISQAMEELYQFSWFTYCDWYLEILKASEQQARDSNKQEQLQEIAWVACESFRTLLQMWHPFIPFITEDIFQAMSYLQDETWLTSRSWHSESSVVEYSPCLTQAMEIISSVRSVKAATGLPYAEMNIAISNKENFNEESLNLINSLARVTLIDADQIPQDKRLKRPYSAGIITVEIADIGNYLDKVRSEIEKLDKYCQSLEKKLSGEFSVRADPTLVKEEKDKLTTSQKMLAEYKAELALSSS